jgi:hypothetical protein
MASSRKRFLDHTRRRATVGRTPLDEWSVRRRDLYLTTQNIHNRQTSMSLGGGIRTHDRSRRAAVDLRLRPRGCWDRQLGKIGEDNSNLWATDTTWALTRYRLPILSLKRRILLIFYHLYCLLTAAHGGAFIAHVVLHRQNFAEVRFVFVSLPSHLWTLSNVYMVSFVLFTLPALAKWNCWLERATFNRSLTRDYSKLSSKAVTL